jgi:hypothetical protein
MCVNCPHIFHGGGRAGSADSVSLPTPVIAPAARCTPAVPRDPGFSQESARRLSPTPTAGRERSVRVTNEPSFLAALRGPRHSGTPRGNLPREAKSAEGRGPFFQNGAPRPPKPIAEDPYLSAGARQRATPITSRYTLVRCEVRLATPSAPKQNAPVLPPSHHHPGAPGGLAGREPDRCNNGVGAPSRTDGLWAANLTRRRRCAPRRDGSGRGDERVHAEIEDVGSAKVGAAGLFFPPGCCQGKPPPGSGEHRC